MSINREILLGITIYPQSKRWAINKLTTSWEFMLSWNFSRVTSMYQFAFTQSADLNDFLCVLLIIYNYANHYKLTKTCFFRCRPTLKDSQHSWASIFRLQQFMCRFESTTNSSYLWNYSRVSISLNVILRFSFDIIIYDHPFVLKRMWRLCSYESRFRSCYYF